MMKKMFFLVVASQLHQAMETAPQVTQNRYRQRLRINRFKLQPLRCKSPKESAVFDDSLF